MTESDELNVLARSVESLRPAASPPAWAEIGGTLRDPTTIRWHDGVETLIGFRAPPECAAIAVVANGWGHGVHDPCSDRAGPIVPGERRRIRVVCLVTRAGERAGYLRIGSHIAVHEAPAQGRVLDSMLRSFGLPTAPPESTARVQAVVWLANLEAHVLLANGPLTWEAAANLHPGVIGLEALGETVPLDLLPDVLRASSTAWTWSDVAETLGDIPPPEIREWMDEGMLSRWLTDALPDVDALLARVSARLPPAVVSEVRATLDQLNLLDEPSPAQ